MHACRVVLIPISCPTGPCPVVVLALWSKCGWSGQSRGDLSVFCVYRKEPRGYLCYLSTSTSNQSWEKCLYPRASVFFRAAVRVTVTEAWSLPAPLWAGLHPDRPYSDLWAPSSERRHSAGNKGPEQQRCPSEGSRKSLCDSMSSAFPTLKREDVGTVFMTPHHYKTLRSFPVTPCLTETNKQKNWTHGNKNLA